MEWILIMYFGGYHAELGPKDTNGMPEKLLVVPSYGVDFAYVYERSEKTAGPQW